MAPLNVEIQFTGDPRQACEVAKERLELLPLVETADFHIDQTRQGFAEPISIILGTVVFLKVSTAAVSQLRILLRELAGLQKDLTGTQSILVDIDGEKLEPDKIDDKALAELVEGLKSSE
jgi:hypothetical protein